MSENQDPIRCEIHGQVGILTIDRPKTLNALDVPTLLALEAGLMRLEENAAVRAIVITGSGQRAFVAGGDIADLDSRQGLAHYREFAEIIHRVFRRFELCDKPTIGAINGWALGGGTELLLTFDIRLVAEEAKLGLPEITWACSRGRRHAAHHSPDLAVPGEDADVHGRPDHRGRGRNTGPVQPGGSTRDADDGGAGTGRAHRAEVAADAQAAQAHAARRRGHAIAGALAHEQAMIGLVLDSADAHEGCRAFMEKRSARFEGH